MLPTHQATASKQQIRSLKLLSQLQVEAESNSNSYERSLFRHWVDENGNRCDTRAEVLLRDTKSPVTRSGTCTIRTGKWVSVYDNQVITNASSLDIDHVVALKEAWESGASGWTSSERQQFANDLGFNRSLIAVSASTNRSKSDRDPTNWLPPSNAYRCEYLVSWIQVKYRWRLRVDESERNTIRAGLRNCGNPKVLLPPRKTVSDNPVTPSPTPTSDGTLDPRFTYCYEVIAAGYGPYYKGVDPEYYWYRDGDKDGIACEK
ncbi:MAG: hypothetical protein RIS09_236 [Actinomycetota bacterium]